MPQLPPTTAPGPTRPTPSGLPRAVVVLLGFAAAVVLVAGLKAAGGIVGPTTLALVLAITFHPLRTRLQRRGVPSWLASVTVLVAVYLVLVLLTLALVVSVGRLAVILPSYTPDINSTIAHAGSWLAARGVGEEQVQAAVKAVDVGKVVSIATSVLSSVLGVLSDLFFLAVLLLFMTLDGSTVARLSEGMRDKRPELVGALESFAHGTRSYVSVSAFFGLIVAVIDTFALWIMGVPGAFVWGVLSFVTNFVPNIGFVIGLVPPAVIALLEGGPGLALGVVVVYSAINVVIQSLIQPRIVGNVVGLSGTLTMLSLVFWAYVIGPLGALLAIPMSLLLKALLVEADPDARWLDPLLSGRPAQPAVASSRGADGPSPKRKR